MRLNKFLVSNAVKLLLLCPWYFHPLFSYGQSKSIKTSTEYSIETKGGKEVEIPRLFQAWDARGNLLEVIDYDSEGKQQDHVKNEYNEKSQKTKETHFTSDGKIDEVSVYEYDEHGNRTAKTVTDINGKLKSKKKYTYEYYQ